MELGAVWYWFKSILLIILYKIGVAHTKKMAEGKLPLGHIGFNGRCNQVSFSKKGMYENVAYNNDTSDVAKVFINYFFNS